MDFKNTNTTVPSLNADDDNNQNSNNMEHSDNTPVDSPIDDVPIPTKPTEHVDFIFGNGSVAPLLSANPIIPAAVVQTNGNKRRSDQLDQDTDEEDAAVDGDFGPETDVDAVDEGIVSPVSASAKETFNEADFDTNALNELNYKKSEYDQDFNQATTNNNPFSVQVVSNDLVDKFNEFAHIEDNKFLETVMEDVDEIQSAKKGIDFSEKKEFSFEREEYEKELDSLSDVTAALNDVVNEVVAAAAETLSRSDEPEIQSPTNNNDDLLEPTIDHDSFIVPESEHGKCNLSYIFSLIAFIYLLFVMFI